MLRTSRGRNESRSTNDPADGSEVSLKETRSARLPAVAAVSLLALALGFWLFPTLPKKKRVLKLSVRLRMEVFSPNNLPPSPDGRRLAFSLSWRQDHLAANMDRLQPVLQTEKESILCSPDGRFSRFCRSQLRDDSSRRPVLTLAMSLVSPAILEQNDVFCLAQCHRNLFRIPAGGGAVSLYRA